MELANNDLLMTSTSAKLNVTIVDDHPIYIDGFKSLLGKFPFINVVATFSSADDLFDNILNLNVEIIFLDVYMPEIKGWDIVVGLKKINSKAKIVALTYSTEGYVVKKMEESGVDGYISKSTNEKELAQLFSSLQRDEKYITPEAVLNKTFEIKESAFKLTDRELELVRLLADERPRIEIAKTLGVSERTIDRENLKLFEKLGVSSATGAVALALKMKII